MGLLDQLAELFNENGIELSIFEDIEDPALGNGGLGRLAACFLDSAATHNIPLNGYGIRYKYGLFKQYFENGFQRETADDWQRFGDPWSIRRESEKVLVEFKNQQVYAVPYDMPVIGYGGKRINTLRLWQAEPVNGFDFQLFNAQKYDRAVRDRDEAEAISSVLYPNDDTDKGKRLRLKQQYFFSSASSRISCANTNRSMGMISQRSRRNMHPVERHPSGGLYRRAGAALGGGGRPFGRALKIARQTFAYTNHTIMAEALEKWDVRLLSR